MLDKKVDLYKKSYEQFLKILNVQKKHREVMLFKPDFRAILRP